MKRKNLSKKIRRLEARLQKGAAKLAKLKQKLAAAATAGVATKKKKSAARVGKSREAVEASERTQNKKRLLKPQSQMKRKLNLTPERRAQLAAAMKARWVAKRATADANTQNTSTEQGFAPGQGSQPQ